MLPTKKLRATNTKKATTPTRKKTVLETNLKIIRLSKGNMSVDTFTFRMGWASVATYYAKARNNSAWRIDEICRLCKLSGRSFEEIFTKPLLG